MSKFFRIFVLFFAVAILGSCGGGGSSSKQVTVSWDANAESAVNTTGGGYILYYSQTNGFDVSSAQSTTIPYASGSTAPTTVTLTLPTGTWYLRLSAYGLSKGVTKTSTPCAQVALSVGV